MGRKKYYCEFCNRSFNDDHNTRLKHLNSLSHLKLKKEHYDLFKDPETILKEETIKKPCRRFQNEGFCPFGSNCTYSHYSQQQLEDIQQEVNETTMRKTFLHVPSLESWLAKRSQQKLHEMQKNSATWNQSSAFDLASSAAFFPPSLLPFDVKEYATADVSSWG